MHGLETHAGWPLLALLFLRLQSQYCVALGKYVAFVVGHICTFGCACRPMTCQGTTAAWPSLECSFCGSAGAALAWKVDCLCSCSQHCIGSNRLSTSNYVCFATGTCSSVKPGCALSGGVLCSFFVWCVIRFSCCRHAIAIDPHVSVELYHFAHQVTCRLVICRYGFNPGSALAILGSSTTAAVAAVNTTLSGAAGTLSALLILMIIEYVSTGRPVWDLIGASNGTLAGLVGITAACAVAEVRTTLQRCSHANTMLRRKQCRLECLSCCRAVSARP